MAAAEELDLIKWMETTNGGDHGSSVNNDITGTSVAYAGGGGGGSDQSSPSHRN